MKKEKERERTKLNVAASDLACCSLHFVHFQLTESCLCESCPQVSKTCSTYAWACADFTISAIWFQDCDFSRLISLLSALVVGIHYQIPRWPSLHVSFSPLCLQSSLFQCKSLLNATKSSSPTRVHGYPSRPLKGAWIRANRAVLFYTANCMSCVKMVCQIIFPPFITPMYFIF